MNSEKNVVFIVVTLRYLKPKISFVYTKPARKRQAEGVAVVQELCQYVRFNNEGLALSDDGYRPCVMAREPGQTFFQ